ncbi:MAG: N-6 DNA methylase [Terracidiphilus sp.]|jgi:hypothetical protein
MRFALLNGASGNFCLDFEGGNTQSARASAAWSTDVGHYVTLDGDRLLLTKWDRPSSEETYSLKSVLEKLHEFHRYLEKETPNRAKSVVAHSLRLFRKIRAICLEDTDGSNSLLIFLHLLASSGANIERIGEQEAVRWGLSAEIVQLSRTLISDATWSALQRDFYGLGEFDVLRPDVSLVLRHAAGTVFEEAHRAATLSPTMWLPGFERPVDISKQKLHTAVGVFFTPAALARTLSEESILSLGDLNVPEIAIFDPACGSGELLREVFRQIRLKSYTGKIRIIGWDVSRIASQMARFILHWEQRSWTMFELSVEIETKDSLVAGPWPDAIDLLIMNPPFLAWTRMSADQQSVAKEILGDMQVNRPNLAMLFSAKGINAVRNGGILASIVPNSFLESTSTSPLRRRISEQASVELIARLGSQNVFSDALVDAGFYIAKKGHTKSTGAVVVWSDSQPASYSRALRGLRQSHDETGTRVLSDSGASDEYSIYVREDAAKSGGPWKAREFRAWQFFSRLTESRKTIPAKKLFDINQGVRMGDDVFIVPKEYFQSLGKQESEFFRPAVMNPSFQDGKLVDSHYIFYPNTTGLPPIENDGDLALLLPRFFNDVLSPNEARLRARKSLHVKERWWGLSEPRRMFENQAPRIISKYFGRERPFVFDPEGRFVVVVGHSWSIRSDAIPVKAITGNEIYLAMIAFLNSSIFTALASYASVQISGGQMDLSNRYVDLIPLPNPGKLTDKTLHRLVDVGQHILTAEATDWRFVDEEVSSIVLSL